MKKNAYSLLHLSEIFAVFMCFSLIGVCKRRKKMRLKLEYTSSTLQLEYIAWWIHFKFPTNEFITWTYQIMKSHQTENFQTTFKKLLHPTYLSPDLYDTLLMLNSSSGMLCFTLRKLEKKKIKYLINQRPFGKHIPFLLHFFTF